MPCRAPHTSVGNFHATLDSTRQEDGRLNRSIDNSGHGLFTNPSRRGKHFSLSGKSAFTEGAGMLIEGGTRTRAGSIPPSHGHVGIVRFAVQNGDLSLDLFDRVVQFHLAS